MSMRCLVFTALLLIAASYAADEKTLPPLEHLCQFNDGAIPESSGVVESPKWGANGIYWTHPDSKNKPKICAFTLKGQVLRECLTAISVNPIASSFSISRTS